MARKVLVQDDALTPVQQYIEGALDTITNADNSVYAHAQTDTFIINNDNGSNTQIKLLPDGSVLIGTDTAVVVIAADGSIDINGGNVTIAPDGALTAASLAAGPTTLAGDGSADIGGVFTVAANGAVDIGPGNLTVSAAGVIALGPAVTIDSDASTTIGTGSIVLLGLPTADPVAAGQLWNNLGVVMVSTG